MIAAFLAALFAAPAPPETPRAFLDRLYAGYRDSDFSPLARPQQVFAPALAAAIEEDARLSRDEVGLLDGDPLCQCQDSAGVTAVIDAIDRASDGTTAQVIVRLPGYRPRRVQLRLVPTAAGWRIADVATADSPSLLSDLRRSNRRRR